MTDEQRLTSDEEGGSNLILLLVAVVGFCMCCCCLVFCLICLVRRRREAEDEEFVAYGLFSDDELESDGLARLYFALHLVEGRQDDVEFVPLKRGVRGAYRVLYRTPMRYSNAERARRQIEAWCADTADGVPTVVGTSKQVWFAQTEEQIKMLVQMLAVQVAKTSKLAAQGSRWQKLALAKPAKEEGENSGRMPIASRLPRPAELQKLASRERALKNAAAAAEKPELGVKVSLNGESSAGGVLKIQNEMSTSSHASADIDLGYLPLHFAELMAKRPGATSDATFFEAAGATNPDVRVEVESLNPKLTGLAFNMRDGTKFGFRVPEKADGGVEMANVPIGGSVEAALAGEAPAATFAVLVALPTRLQPVHGPTLTLAIEPSKKVADLMGLIASVTGVSAGEQHLSFRGAPLAPGWTVEQARIAEGDLVLLTVPSAVLCAIDVVLPEALHAAYGKKMTVSAGEATTVGEVRLAVETATGATVRFDLDHDDGASLGAVDQGTLVAALVGEAPKTESVFVALPSSLHANHGPVLKLAARPSHTVSAVKDAIASVVGVGAACQQLTFRGEPLVEGRLGGAGVKDGDTLKLAVTSSPLASLNVLLPAPLTTVFGPTLAFAVTARTAVGELKSKLRLVVGPTPGAEIALALSGAALSDDDVKLGSVPLSNGGVVEATLASAPPPAPRVVNVELPPALEDVHGSTMTIAAPAGCTVADLKGALGTALKASASSMALAFKEAPLADADTLEAAGVAHDDDLALTMPTAVRTVKVNLPAELASTFGPALVLAATEHTEGADVLERVCAAVGVAPGDLSLSAGGDALGLDAPIGACGVTDGGSLDAALTDVLIAPAHCVAVSLPPFLVPAFGPAVTVAVRPGATAQDVKSNVATLVDVDASACTLASRLNADKMLEDAAVLDEDDDQLLLEMPFAVRSVTVSLPDHLEELFGGELVLAVTEGTRVSELAATVCELTSLPAAALALSHAGTPLDGTSTLMASAVPDGGVVDASIAAAADVQVANSVKVALPRSLQAVHGATLTIASDPAATVGELKTTISAATGVASGLQTLTFHGVTLADEAATLASCKVTGGNTLLLAVPSASLTHVRVRTPALLRKKFGPAVTFAAGPATTVRAIKAKLAAIYAVAAEALSLTYEQSPLADEAATLGACRVVDGGAIDAVLAGEPPAETFAVMVLLPPALQASHGSTLIVATTPTAKVAEVKAKIEMTTGAPVSAQLLAFRGKVLVDTAPLSAVGVTDGSRVMLTVSAMPSTVTVVLPPALQKRFGARVTVAADASAKVKDVKATVAAVAGVEPAALSLAHGGAALQDNDTLSEAGVARPEPSSVASRQFGLLPSGSLATFNVQAVPVLPKSHEGKVNVGMTLRVTETGRFTVSKVSFEPAEAPLASKPYDMPGGSSQSPPPAHMGSGGGGAQTRGGAAHSTAIRI